MAPPLITSIYTADPSAHVFNGKVYIYPSHDRDTEHQYNDEGDQFDMVDYHVFSMDSLAPPAEVTDHGVVLRMEDVPWVSKQLWAPDAAEKNGKYYLYFPARDKRNLFRIGVAVADKPEGPFVPDPEPIKSSYSIDPASFVDDDGQAYLYFGGIWGGQMQCFQNGPDSFDEAWLGSKEKNGEGVSAQGPLVARLTEDMHQFAGDVQEIAILDPGTRKPLLADDHARRFFEAAWMHKRGQVYYLSYSTGDTHYICYATSQSPEGPFVYGGRILEPVIGWTTHHSVVEFQDRTYLFYHDCERSDGRSNLRSVKVKEIFYDEDGAIITTKAD